MSTLEKLQAAQAKVEEAVKLLDDTDYGIIAAHAPTPGAQYGTINHRARPDPARCRRRRTHRCLQELFWYDDPRAGDPQPTSVPTTDPPRNGHERSADRS